MNKEDRLELEQELLLTCSKARAINKYIDELEENTILTNQWYKSQQENKLLKERIKYLERSIERQEQKAIDNYNDYISEVTKKDKATKYLNKLGTQDGMIKDYKIDRFIKEDLLDILEGDNNE